MLKIEVVGVFAAIYGIALFFLATVFTFSGPALLLTLLIVCAVLTYFIVLFVVPRRKYGRTRYGFLLKIVALTMVLLGFISLLASALYDSYVSAFIGLGMVFWGSLLLLIMPTKHVRLELLTATSSSLLTEVEEILSTTASNSKGIYLPPKLLRDYQSSLVFIPAKSNEILPKQEEIAHALKTPKTSRGLVLTPPGLALSRLFEKEMGKSFTELNLDQLQKELPKLLEELEITKTTNIRVENSVIIVEVGNHIFKDLCEETRKLQLTQEAVGCPFSSAIACALAKATGKPAIIEKEEQSPDGVTTIRYRLMEE